MKKKQQHGGGGDCPALRPPAAVAAAGGPSQGGGWKRRRPLSLLPFLSLRDYGFCMAALLLFCVGSLFYQLNGGPPHFLLDLRHYLGKRGPRRSGHLLRCSAFRSRPGCAAELRSCAGSAGGGAAPRRRTSEGAARGRPSGGERRERALSRVNVR